MLNTKCFFPVHISTLRICHNFGVLQFTWGKQFYCFNKTIRTKTQRGFPDTNSNFFDDTATCMDFTTCVSLRVSPLNNDKALQRNIIKFLKPAVEKLRNINLKSNNHQSLVILATPAHLAWLENKNVRKYLSDLLLDGAQTSSYEVDVICACVDGLAPCSEELIRGQQKDFHEGISMLWGTSVIQTPNFCPGSSSPLAGPDDKCSIIFQSKTSNYQVTMPLANTIFKNGKRSTLSVSRWCISEEGAKQHEGPVYPLNASINVFSSEEKFFIQISAKSLTVPRIIEKGFGNIIRKLKTEPGVLISASYELEQAISESHRSKASKSKSSDLEYHIWALIIPKNLLNKETRQFKLDWSSNQELSASYITNLIWRGAKICRVLSGGGGWGDKQGLLSLDPISTFEESDEAQIDLITYDELTREKQAEILGEMAQEGALIQFLQVTDNHKSAISPSRDYIKYNEVVLGNYNDNNSELAKAVSSSHLFIPGLFGCVSTSGIFLRSTGIGSSKIDFPYSYIYGRCLGSLR